LHNETFESGSNGWTTEISIAGNATEWAIQNSPHSTRSPMPPPYLPVSISSNTNDHFYLADNTPGLMNPITSLISPVINFAANAYTTLTLDFWTYYRDKDASDNAYVDISTDGGLNYSNLEVYTQIQGYPENFAHKTVNLSAYIAETDIRIRFRFMPTWDYYWAIDNVKVTGTSPITGFSWTSVPSGYTNNVNVSPTGLTQLVTTQ